MELVGARSRLGGANPTWEALYAVHYAKKNGVSRKVFKLRETELPPGGDCELAIGQTVKDFTTRKHNAGFHRVELLVNGEVKAEAGFELTV